MARGDGEFAEAVEWEVIAPTITFSGFSFRALVFDDGTLLLFPNYLLVLGLIMTRRMDGIWFWLSSSFFVFYLKQKATYI